ncbi:MAG TPA: hypothetical protein VJ803_08120 [Gemmatimonadaceae bacterium]|nr:hypothetical protein [Gemmatimonadaceae bacterium]
MSVPMSRRRRIAVMVLVLGAFWLTRAIELGHFVTPDEQRWITRSANFFQALWARKTADTFQSNHPGVTAMWVGTIVFVIKYPEYPEHVRAQASVALEGVGAVLRAQGRSPLEMLVTARALMLVLHTAVLIAVAWYAVRLIGFGPTMVAGILLAVDPFHISNTRIFHLDALEGEFLMLSVLALVSHARLEGRQGDLVVSGVAGGLAVITKIPAIGIVMFAGVFLLAYNWVTRSREPAERTKWLADGAKSMVIWSVSALAIAMLLWPTLWDGPRYTLQRLFLGSLRHVGGGGNQAAEFFLGSIERRLSPLYYPVSYLWVVTPPFVAGLVLAAVAWFKRWRPLDDVWHRRACLVVLVFAAGFVLELMNAGIKAQRYLLPAHLALVLLAGVGWFAAAERLWRLEGRRAVRLAGAALLAVLVVQHAVALVRSAPYYYTYDNVLVGGRRTLRMVMSDGGGEGLDQAARYLNALPGSEQLVVCSWYGQGPFSYYFRGKTTGLEARWSDELAERLESADYLVAYTHQWQRKMPSEQFLNYLDRIKPEHVVRIDGFEYARIYRLRGTRIAADLRALHDSDVAAGQPASRS